MTLPAELDPEPHACYCEDCAGFRLHYEGLRELQRKHSGVASVSIPLKTSRLNLREAWIAHQDRNKHVFVQDPVHFSNNDCSKTRAHTSMAQATDRPDLDIKCAKARPWVRRFVEDYEDGRPWGYAIYEDPVVDNEKMERGMSRISLLLRIAQVAVYGGDHRTFPKFEFEVLDWPGETDEGPGGKQQGDGDAGGGEVSPMAAAQSSDTVVKAAPEQTSPETEVEKPKDLESTPEQTPVISSPKQAAQQQSDDSMGFKAITEDTKRDYDYDDEEDVDDDAEIDLGSEDTEEEIEEVPDHQGKDDDREESEESEESEDDADIDLVKELPTLREHFKWVCHQKKRRRVNQSQDVDRSGIPRGLLRKVFIVLDDDSIDSILGNPPIVDDAWVWAIDPNYTGDVASMTKDGLREEYYGYMRVRVQQLVNNFWAEMYQDDRPLSELWEAAKQSLNCAFVSVDPEEAQISRVSMDVGSVLRAP